MRTLALLGLAAALAGCGQQTPTDNTQDDSFIALTRDFDNFQSWETFHVAGDGTTSPHTGANHDIYLKHRPPAGATEFPIGTIIVKHTDGLSATDGPRTFAMVKRGGDFNATGALNWEWFELVQTDTSVANSPWAISWRGSGPPAGNEYGSGANSTCNDCHAQAKANDYVQASVLQLSSLEQ